ncbi:MAG: hypothetical protein V7739_02240 [Motiliproteus sp.]
MVTEPTPVKRFKWLKLEAGCSFDDYLNEKVDRLLVKLSGNLYTDPAYENPPLPTPTDDTREAIYFANLFGDGKIYLMRIRNGSIECWPKLGNGRFGPKVEMANAPYFGDEMDAAQLYLIDIDGSGSTGLVYAYIDHVDLYLNKFGKDFGDPISILLPYPWQSTSQFSFADVLGNGTACLIFTSLNSDLSIDHQYYDIMGGEKP